MNEGPTEFIKLSLEGTTNLIHSHFSQPFLLRTTSKALTNYNTKHLMAVKQIPLHEQIEAISAIAYAGTNLVCAVGQDLKINEKKLHVHRDPIVHLLADEHGVMISAARSSIDKTIKVSWANKQEEPCVMGEFSFHYEPVSSILWKNSLVISGDSRGDVCLWDVNKMRMVLHRKAHYEPIEFIGTHVDFTVHNIFYTLAPEEKRIIFSDLRTNKPIKILANLHSDNIVSVEGTSSGKVLIAYQDLVGMVDIYDQYTMKGVFSPVVADKASQMRWTSKSFSFDKLRKITQMKTIAKYAVVGCDNGCIEVYDTDTLECLYGFGLTKYGPIKGLEINKVKREIYGLDSEGEVYMCRFGEPLND